MRLLALLVILIPGLVSAQSLNDFLLTEKEALMLLPAKVVAGGQVHRARWSPSGRYVLVEVRDHQLSTADLALAMAGEPAAIAKANPIHRLLLWNARTERTQEVLQVPANLPLQLHEPAWLVGSDFALILLQRLNDPKGDAGKTIFLYRLAAGTGQAARVHQDLLANAADVLISPSPTRPVAILTIDRTAPSGGSLLRSFVLVDVSGRVLGKADGIAGGGYPIWSPDGSIAYIMMPSVRGQKSVPLMRIDFATGTLVPVPGATPEQVRALFGRFNPDEEKALVLEERAMAIGDQKVDVLWLRSKDKTERPEALVATDTTWGQLSPTADAVLFITQQVAMVRPLARISKELYLKHVESAQRSALLSQGKQLAMGLLMFAHDNDDVFPAPGDGVNKLLAPYLKNSELFQGFAYTYPGGAMGAIKDPSTTELGYVQGAGGSAIIFADGSVRWRPN